MGNWLSCKTINRREMQEEYSTENTKRIWVDNELSGKVIGHAMEVHNSLGPVCWKVLRKNACISNLQRQVST